MEEATIAIMHSTKQNGNQTEKQRAVTLLKQLCRHSCSLHSKEVFVNLLRKRATLAGPTAVQPADDDKILADDQSTGKVDKTHRPMCQYEDLCKKFFSTLEVQNSFLDERHNRCYCASCMERRGDQTIYNRGEPPKPYSLPKGWYRVALKVPPRCTALKVFTQWHVAYHGTTTDAVKQILFVGDLLMPGDKTPGREIKEREGHIQRNNPTGFKTDKVFLSPSMKYSGQDVYAKAVQFQNDGKLYQAHVGFQVRIQPDTYTVGPETLGATNKGHIIDPNFSNNELEWSTDQRGVIILNAIVVGVFDKN